MTAVVRAWAIRLANGEQHPATFITAEAARDCIEDCFPDAVVIAVEIMEVEACHAGTGTGTWWRDRDE